MLLTDKIKSKIREKNMSKVAVIEITNVISIDELAQQSDDNSETIILNEDDETIKNAISIDELAEQSDDNSETIILNEDEDKDKDVNLKKRFADNVEQITQKGKKTMTEITKFASNGISEIDSAIENIAEKGKRTASDIKKITDTGISKASDAVEQVAQKGKKAFETVKAKVIHICEIITKRKLREIIVSKMLKKCMVSCIDSTSNTIYLKELETGSITEIHGTGIADDVQIGLIIS